MSFTNIFGGSPVSPADVAYASYSFSSNLTLVWPQFANGNPDVAARFMNMIASASGLNVSMPDATLNSVGYDAIVFNAGFNSFNVVTLNGNAIVTIAPGQTYYIMLNNNSTPDGGWQTVQFGVGTGSANASALAGAGLLALAGLLVVNFDAVMVSSSYTLTAIARDILQVWTGGSGTITLPQSSSVGNGFMFPLANNGSGSVTVATSGGDLIDGASSSVFSQTQSGFIISTGTGWVTVGKGIQNTFSVTLLNLNVAGSSDVTETSAQAQNIIQQFTGVLTGNINVIVPNTVQLYFCYNETTGPFTLTLKTAAGTGLTVAQGSHTILYCDGTNVVNAFTATITSNLTIPAGSASSPSLNVTGSLTTGLFSGAANTISVAAGGNEVTRYISASSAVNYLTETASATGQAVLISAAGTDAAIPINIAGKGGAAVQLPNADVTGGTLDGVTIGGVTPGAITGTTIQASTGFTGNLTGNISGTAPAALLTGTALASNVVSSSLTSVGTLVNLTVTNPIAGSVTGNAATVTTNANLTGPITSSGNATTVSSSINLPGAPTTTTPATSDNSTAIPTTAFVKNQGYITNTLVNALGVGSIIIASQTSGGTIAAGSTTSASNLQVRTLSGTTGDSITGTWLAFQTLINTATGLWQRIS